MSEDLRSVLGNSVLTCKHRGVHGDWRIENKNAKLYLRDIAHLCIETRIVNFEDVAWRSQFRKSPDNTTVKYLNADISFPPILCEDAPNPFGKKYRLLDGVHRMSKMLNSGMTESSFYIVKYNDVRPFFKYFKEKPNDPI